jgi:NADH-quinone oxidoreductase subunit G
VQRLKKAVAYMGAKPDLEIIGLLAKEMGTPLEPISIRADGQAESLPHLVRSDHNTLFTSGTLGRYSKVLNSVLESRSRP